MLKYINKRMKYVKLKTLETKFKFFAPLVETYL
jgi:hypothetical protein